MLYTLCIAEQRYTTILLRTDDAVKMKKCRLLWMGKHIVNLNDIALWDAELFPIADSRQESLHATLSLLEKDDVDFGEEKRLSMANASAQCNLQEMISYRRDLKEIRSE